MITVEEQKEFDELSAFVKANGFMKLDTQEKRRRYSELKAKVEDSTVPITLTKAELQEMIDKSIDAYKSEAKKSFESSDEGLEEAKKIGQWIKSKQVKKQNPVAKLRVYREDGLSEGGIIVDWRFVKNVFNEETRRFDVPLYQITVRYETEEKKYELPLTQIMQINEFENVEIIKQDIENVERVTGFGQKAYNKSGYNFSDPGMFGVKGQMSGETFEFKETATNVICTVKRPNGKLLVINNNQLNK